MLRTFPPFLVVLLSLLAAGCGGGGGGSGDYGAPTCGPLCGLAEDDYAGEGSTSESGDRYDATGTNPFVLAASDPLSTFSVDVDTASYEIFRRDVLDGGLPAPDSVRLEEYVNYFGYDYPAPEFGAEVPFTVALDGAPSPFTEGTTLLRVGIRGMQPPPSERKPANLVFLVDVSGSMTDVDKLPLVKVVLRETLDVLQPTDTVSIVTYASSTGVRLTPTPVSEKHRILAEVEALESGGSTSGAAGIELAYEQAQAGFIEGGLNHVLLCTDGDFNVGLAGTNELVALIEDERATGVTFTVLGFGVGNLNDAMMEAISNKGNGVYGFIADEHRALDYVHDRLLSTMTFIAKDVKIQVEMNAARVLAYRLLGYENRAIDDDLFTDDTIDAGEIGAGHTVTALYELVLSGGTVPAPTGAPAVWEGTRAEATLDVGADQIALVKVRFDDIDAAADATARQVSTGIGSEGLAASFDTASRDLRWAASVAAFAEILKRSPYGDAGHLAAIGAVFAAECGTDADRLELAQLFEAARARIPTPAE